MSIVRFTLFGMILGAIAMNAGDKKDAPDKIITYKTIGGEKLALHVFEPAHGTKNASGAPAVIFFFGGGWVSGSPAQFHPHCRHFSSKGFVAISAEYRIRGKHGTTPFESVKDAKSAIRHIRSHAGEFGISTDRIIAAGGSAGGHLAACTALIEGNEEDGEDLGISSVPNGLILFNPVLDTTETGYGADRFKGREKELSPVHHIRPKLPACIIFHGTADKTVPFENASRFKKLMDENGNYCELVPFEGKDHGFFNHGKDGNHAYEETLRAIEQFFIGLRIK